MGVRFYLNKRKSTGNDPVGVALVALRGETQIKVLTSVKVKPSDWAPKQQRVRSAVPGSTDLNGALARLKSDAERMLLDFPDDEGLREALRSRLGKKAQEATPSVLDLFERFLEGKRARYRESTVQVYNTLQGHLQGFVSKDAKPETIGAGWLDDFAAYLVGKGLQNTTTNKLLTRTKGFLRWMVERGALATVPAAKPLPTASNFALYLSAEELARLAAVDLSGTVPRRGHEAARDLFVFAAVTGQRFADVQAMEWDDLRPKGSPETWFLYVKKTNTTLPVPLPSPARAIIEGRRSKARPMPKLSNQKANEFLKGVARLAGIDEPVTIHRMKGGERVSETSPKHEAITTHAARKTFVTLALQSGLSMNELLGFTHQDLKSLKVYAGQDHSRLRAALHGVFDGLTSSSLTPDGSDGTEGSDGSEGN
jgi:site-specific recombinase XerD